ncbi:glycoside hydrolase family 172 protein [Calditrichota bacterium]
MKIFSFCFFIILFAGNVFAQSLYEIPDNVKTHWTSFENQKGDKGKGGIENKGAKGHAFDNIPAGASKTLLSVEGSGIIHRIWITIRNRSPKMLRSLKIEMFWDNASKPAVSAPFGDFFGVSLGLRTPFESELFSDPEGRSFNCFIPMPFQKNAKIILTNESDEILDLTFFDINYTISEAPNKNALYFHCYWNREQRTTLGKDFEILPKVEGKGRFLGTNIGVFENPDYKGAWWGEGEVKVYLDGDSDFPTLVGTGTEDYIGTAWGEGKFSHQYQGCLIADKEKGLWAFYRYHIPDPVYFHNDCKVTIQQMGGEIKHKVIELIDEGADLIPVTISRKGQFTKLLEMDLVPDLKNELLHEGWTNFYRQDDVSATAYFYLDKAENNLPKIALKETRTINLPALK